MKKTANQLFFSSKNQYKKINIVYLDHRHIRHCNVFPNEHYNQDLPNLGGNGNSIPLGNRPCNFRDLNSLGDILLKYNEGHSIRPHIDMCRSYIGHEGCNEDRNLVPRICGLANRIRKHRPYPHNCNERES